MTPSPAGRRVAVVSPVRNEEATLGRTIEAMVAQTLRPVVWVVVDDGSTDRTTSILEDAARRHPWIRVLRRADRGRRRVGPGVVEAFYDGLAALDVPHEYLAKVDGDLEFAPRYLERLVARFEADPRLGGASGKVFVRRPSGSLEEEFMVDAMVAGQFQTWRREAFDAIGGFVRAVMWDGIAFHRARMCGWETRSFPDPELRLIELRPMGASEGNVLRGRLRWGRGQWFMGSAFPYVLASGLFRMRERPRVVGGLLIVAGYLAGWLGRQPRYDDAGFRRDLRRWQYHRLGRLVRGRGVR